MRFYVHIFRVEGETLVAACDEDIYGKCFEEGKLILEVKKDFYGSDLKEWGELLALLEEAIIANLVGEDVVTNAVRAGFIDPNNVLRVKGIPHAQMVII